MTLSTYPDSHTRSLARFAAELRFDDIPRAVVHQAERLILDTCACAVAGYRLDNAKTFLHIMKGSGKPEATLFPTGDKASVATAAFVNTALSNALDMDDNLLYHTHFANTSIMPAVAMAERQGASGADLVTAVLAAYEATARITLAQPGGAKFELSHGQERFGLRNYNIFSAAVGAGKLLGLDTQRMVYAMGIAGMNAPVPSDGADWSPVKSTLKGTTYGWQGWTGVTAALLAEQGITGHPSILDGEKGFWRMSGAESCNFSTLSNELGSKWWILDTTIKFYPAGTWMRQAMAATDKIVQSHDIKPDEIEKIVIKHAHAPSKYTDNPWARGEPVNDVLGQTNFPYLVAMRALRIPPVRWHSKETYTNPSFLSFMKKVYYQQDPAMAKLQEEEVARQVRALGVRRSTKTPTTVDIHARGTVFSEYVEIAKGDPITAETRLTDEDIANKFREHGDGIIRRSQLEKAIEALLSLSRVADVRTVTPFLTV